MIYTTARLSPNKLLPRSQRERGKDMRLLAWNECLPNREQAAIAFMHMFSQARQGIHQVRFVRITAAI